METSQPKEAVIRTTKESSRDGRRAYVDRPKELRRDFEEALERTRQRLADQRERLALLRRARGRR